MSKFGKNPRSWLKNGDMFCLGPLDSSSLHQKPSCDLSYRSPYFCHYSSIIRTVLLSTILALIVGFVGLVLCAIYYARSPIFFYISAAILLSAASLLTLFYIWLNKRCAFLRLRCSSKLPGAKMEISTVSKPNYYYMQTPPGRKTDYPMGPYLVMTLPKKTNRFGAMETDRRTPSLPSTPGSARKKRLKRSKNLPPLASEETLSPSLMSSSYGSIDSVI